MSPMSDRVVQEIVGKLVAQGWRIEGGHGRHYKAFPPDPSKPMVVFAATPSDWRSMRNAISQLRRSGAAL